MLLGIQVLKDSALLCITFSLPATYLIEIELSLYKVTTVPPPPLPIPSSPPAKISFNNACGTRPSVMNAPCTPNFTASVAYVTTHQEAVITFISFVYKKSYTSNQG